MSSPSGSSAGAAPEVPPAKSATCEASENGARREAIATSPTAPAPEQAPAMPRPATVTGATKTAASSAPRKAAASTVPAEPTIPNAHNAEVESTSNHPSAAAPSGDAVEVLDKLVGEKEKPAAATVPMPDSDSAPAAEAKPKEAGTAQGEKAEPSKSVTRGGNKAHAVGNQRISQQYSQSPLSRKAASPTGAIPPPPSYSESVGKSIPLAGPGSLSPRGEGLPGSPVNLHGTFPSYNARTGHYHRGGRGGLRNEHVDASADVVYGETNLRSPTSQTLPPSYQSQPPPQYDQTQAAAFLLQGNGGVGYNNLGNRAGSPVTSSFSGRGGRGGAFGYHGDVGRQRRNICNQFMQTGTCRFGQMCMFAHVSEEQRLAQLPTQPQYDSSFQAGLANQISTTHNTSSRGSASSHSAVGAENAPAGPPSCSSSNSAAANAESGVAPSRIGATGELGLGKPGGASSGADAADRGVVGPRITSYRSPPSSVPRLHHVEGALAPQVLLQPRTDGSGVGKSSGGFPVAPPPYYPQAPHVHVNSGGAGGTSSPGSGMAGGNAPSQQPPSAILRAAPTKILPSYASKSAAARPPPLGIGLHIGHHMPYTSPTITSPHIGIGSQSLSSCMGKAPPSASVGSPVVDVKTRVGAGHGHHLSLSMLSYSSGDRCTSPPAGMGNNDGYIPPVALSGAGGPINVTVNTGTSGLHTVVTHSPLSHPSLAQRTMPRHPRSLPASPAARGEPARFRNEPYSPVGFLYESADDDGNRSFTKQVKELPK